MRFNLRFEIWDFTIRQSSYYLICIFDIQGIYKIPIHINVYLQEKFKSEFKERVFCNDLRRLCCPRLSNPEDEELALGAIPISQRTNGMELLYEYSDKY